MCSDLKIIALLRNLQTSIVIFYVDTQSIVIFYACGILELVTNTKKRGSGL